MQRLLVPVLAMMVLSSCNHQTCGNSSPELDKGLPTTKEYKIELARQIKRAGNSVSYWIGCYVREKNKDYILVFVQGKGLCAKAYLDVTNNPRMEQFVKVQGRSYSGAELSGLKFKIDSSANNYEFIFEDVDWIVD